MNARVRELVERILEFRREFEDAEIREAIQYVTSKELPDSSSNNQTKIIKSRSKANQSGTSRSTAPKASRVVLALKNADPERYDALTALDSLLRDGKIITTVDGIRALGASLDKSFIAGKSRKEAIPKLMKLLASLPLDQLKEIVESLMQRPQDEEDGSDEIAYSKLAEFLIQGK